LVSRSRAADSQGAQNVLAAPIVAKNAGSNGWAGNNTG